MKLSRDDIVRSESAPPLELFVQGIKAEETREKYTRTLRQVLCGMLEEVLVGDFELRVASLVRYGREEPEWTRDLLLSLSRMLRERTKLPHAHADYLNPVSFGGYFKPIKKLFDMNDIAFPWKRIYATYPELDNVSESRGWTRQEIQLMLKSAGTPMDRAIILVCASSGIRVGGFASLRWKDLVPVYVGAHGRLQLATYAGGKDRDAADGDYTDEKAEDGDEDMMMQEQAGQDRGAEQHAHSDLPEEERDATIAAAIAAATSTTVIIGGKKRKVACATLRIYGGTSESYPAFITPEACRAILDYKQEWVRQAGRRPEPNDPIFKQDTVLVRPASHLSITKRVAKVLDHAGLRGSMPAGKRRHEVPMMNGFRRFWNKTCKELVSTESPLASLIKKEFMMGHTGLVKLDRNYFKTHTLELAEDYLGAVPSLTIDDTTRLREANRRKDNVIQHMESQKDARISDLEKMVARLARTMEK